MTRDMNRGPHPCNGWVGKVARLSDLSPLIGYVTCEGRPIYGVSDGISAFDTPRACHSFAYVEVLGRCCIAPTALSCVDPDVLDAEFHLARRLSTPSDPSSC